MGEGEAETLNTRMITMERLRWFRIVSVAEILNWKMTKKSLLKN